jgi:hypothetical protein
VALLTFALHQMFGFKLTMDGIDHNQVKTQRYRLFGRVLQVNGPHALDKLYPFIMKELQTALPNELKKSRASQPGRYPSSFLQSLWEMHLPVKESGSK